MGQIQNTSENTSENASKDPSLSSGEPGRKKPDIKRLFLIGIPMLLAAIFLKTLDDEARILWFENNTPTHTDARFFRFSGEKERKVKVEAGMKLQVEWEAEVKNGELRADIMNDGERTAALRGAADRWRTRAEDTRSYRLVVRGEEARGSFTISWTTSEAGQ